MENQKGILSICVAEKKIEKMINTSYEDLKPNRYIIVEVLDTGRGISPENIDRIFEPYFTTRENEEGSGLGLAMAHSIVKKSNGKIFVKSDVGKGTVFTVYFPISKEIPERATQISTRLSRGRERILFVDDELAIVNMSKQALKKLGYQVSAFCDSKKALVELKAHPEDFDLVITDMTMPEMTGEKLAAEIIKIKPEIPIILCTGYSKTIFEEKLADMGIKAVMMKPIPFKQMAVKIRSILDQTP